MASAYTTAFTPLLFIELPVPCQESEQSCIYLLRILNLSVFKRFFGWILELTLIWFRLVMATYIKFKMMYSGLT